MRAPPALLLALAATACARDRSNAPSLALRPTELRGFEEPARPHPAAATADPALDAKVADAGARLDALVKGYDAEAARATRDVAAPGAHVVGSDGWLTAQAALARLDGQRSQTVALTGEIDALARTRTEAAGAPYPALATLAARAAAEGERESAAIATLSASLPQP